MYTIMFPQPLLLSEEDFDPIVEQTLFVSAISFSNVVNGDTVIVNKYSTIYNQYGFIINLCSTGSITYKLLVRNLQATPV